MTTEIINIPLNQLTAWKGNVRKTQNKGAIPALAASIEAHGLINPLKVFKEGKKYVVVAGCQRLAAFQLRAKNGNIEKDHPVPCLVEEDETKLIEISLAENTMRENMHPADECDAYKAAVDAGTPLAGIAARFSKTELYVKQRLKLANVSPKIVAAYRDDTIGLEEVMAYSISDDHSAQEKLFSKNKTASSWWIKDQLLQKKVSVNDGRVKFVGEQAYLKAGGTIENPDLFTDEKKGGYITNMALLDKLFEEKLQATLERVVKEGWKWTEKRDSFAYSDRAKYTILAKDMEPLPEKKQKELNGAIAALSKARKALEDYQNSDEYQNCEDEEKIFAKEAKLEEPIDKLTEKIEKINKGRKEFWSSEVLAIAGAIVAVDSNGNVEIIRGLCKPSDKPAAKAKQREQQREAGEEVPEEDDAAERKEEFSSALRGYLDSAKSQAITAELMNNPHVALAAVVHCLASSHFAQEGGHLNIRPTDQTYDELENSAADKAIKDAGKNWGDNIPGSSEKLWSWCLAQDTENLLDLLAFCAAQTVSSWDDDEPLAKAVKLDMKKWFTPTADNFFSRIGKPQIFEAIREAKGQPPAPALEKLKKADLAKEAERLIAGTGWLPEPLR